jgi:hypothetical protein
VIRRAGYVSPTAPRSEYDALVERLRASIGGAVDPDDIDVVTWADEDGGIRIEVTCTTAG